MKDQIINFIETIMRPSPAIFIIGALIVLLVPVLLHFYVARQTPYTGLPSILLTGPRQSGKTSLLVHLERGGGSGHPPATTSPPPKPEIAITHHDEDDSESESESDSDDGDSDSDIKTRGTVVASAVELSFSNTGQNTSNDEVNDAHNLHHRDSTHTRFILRDSASNLKSRHHTMRFIASSASPQASASSKLRALVYVVDAAALGDDSSVSRPALRVAGEYLYTLLLTLQKRTSSLKTSKTPTAISVMIAASKSDLFTALPEAGVRSALEEELSSIRASKRKGMMGANTNADDDNDEWLGAYGTEKFSFDQMREFDVDIDVISGNVIGHDGPNTERWWQWMTGQIH